MELVNQHTKQIMQGCKERARAAGLSFEEETLEYIVTNRDLLELSPKYMIPTLYDYWVHDVEVLREKGRYELYPANPYETVINTRPAISFYNDNNPDWLNVMIFYHVLAHIDFFQNNVYYEHTWDYDFTGQALADKRLIAKFRASRGHWVDYVIEFTRGLDNLVGYYREISHRTELPQDRLPRKLDYYFDVFLQSVKKVRIQEYIKEIDRYNECVRQFGEIGGIQTFFGDVSKQHPEFELLLKKHGQARENPEPDLIEFLMEYSPNLNRDENKWMKSVMQIVRTTALFFQPQIRTKIMNEGWASYWHENLFLKDERIAHHEVDYAVINSGVTTMPRVGLNPYALGMRLFYFIEEQAEQGRLDYDFNRLRDSGSRDRFDTKSGRGRDFIFHVRRNFTDFLFINRFVDQDFVTRNDLFVVGKRLNQERMVWEYFVKSRRVEDYRDMLIDQLYHPPHIKVDRQKSTDAVLYLNHVFEGKPLVKEFIPNTMIGLEYLWGGPVKLETSEPVETDSPPASQAGATDAAGPQPPVTFQRVVYTVEKRTLSRQVIS